jgi:hypothetical protein
MRRTLLLSLLAAPVCVLLACRRDPGREVKPMPNPLGSGRGASPTPSEIIPLDQVSKSQAAAVSLRIANTEIT